MAQTHPVLHPNIHKLIVSQALSKLGDNFTEVALALFVLSITHNNVADLGLVLAMTYAPRILLGWAVVGVIDRFNKRRTMLVADLGRACLVVSIPAVHNFVWTTVAIFLMYSWAMIYQPTIRAIQPQISGDSSINAQSSARQEIYYAVADIAAYLVVAGIVFWWNVSVAFWIDACTYIGASILIRSIHVDDKVWRPARTNVDSFWRSIRDGATYITTNTTLRGVITISVIMFSGVGALNTTLAPLSKFLWHTTSAHYVWFVLALSAGSLMSGIIIERTQTMVRWGPRYLVGLGFLLTGFGFGLVDFASSWQTGLVCLFIAGLGNALYGSSLILWVQQITPRPVRTRVLALRNMGNGIGGAGGALVAGVLASRIGIQFTVMVIFVAWIVLGLAAFLVAQFPLLPTVESEI